MGRLYFAVFYAWCRFDPFGEGPRDDAWRSVGFVSALQVLVLANADMWFAMATGLRGVFNLPRIILAALALALFGINYWLLLRGHRWKQYAREFDEAAASIRKRRTQVAWAVIIAILSGTMATAYSYTQREVRVPARAHPVEWRQ